MRRGVHPWLAGSVRMAAFLALLGGPSSLSAQESIFIPGESGFTYSVSGIEGVGAVAAAAGGGGAAWGLAIVDQTLIGNTVEEYGVNRQTVIEDSVQGNLGILSINQESGNFNNQANVRVIAIAAGAGSKALGISVVRSTTSQGNVVISGGGTRETRISSSFNGTRGIVGVNQSAGNLNQEANVLVLGVGLALGADVFAVEDISLAQVSGDNTLIQDPEVKRADTLVDSFTDFRGIAQITMSSGDLNSIANNLALSVTTVTVP